MLLLGKMPLIIAEKNQTPSAVNNYDFYFPLIIHICEHKKLFSRSTLHTYSTARKNVHFDCPV